MGANQAEQLDAGHLRHLDVAHDNLEWAGRYRFGGLGTVVGRRDLESGCTQEPRNRPREGWFIVCDKNRLGFRLASLRHGCTRRYLRRG